MTRPVDVKYLFIDGGYLRRCYSDSIRKWCGSEGELDFGLIKQKYAAQKSFYYDCLDDLKREGESELDFASRIDEQERFFNRIREGVGSHVRLGSLTGTAKNKRQKEVDILLAVDMMSHAVRENMTRAILLAGDRDFKPVVESLVQMGIFVEVAGDRRHTSKDLAWAADSFRAITFDDYHQWSVESISKEFPIQIATVNMPPHETEVVATGVLDGKTANIQKWSGNNNYYIFVEGFYRPRQHLTLHFHDLEKLKLYFELQYGKVDWQLIKGS